MKSFRDPKYVERYEDVIFDLETALNTTVANNAHQKKDGYRFVVDNSGEVTPFDWYNARISLDFKVVLLVNGGNIAVADHNGIVNGSYSLLKHFDIKLNGKRVYDWNNANHAVNIKNLLEYSPSYADKTASHEFFYLDTSRNVEEREFEVSGTNQLAKRRTEYNNGFALRKALQSTNPITYRLKDLNNEEIQGSFYEPELLPAKQDVFRIEKVIRRDYKKKQALVKWLGYSDDFNSWIPLSNLQELCR